MRNENFQYTWKQAVAFGAGAVVVGGVTFLAMRYKVCNPDQILVRTGLGIRNMEVSKKAIVFPFQQYTFVDMKPITYNFELHNMSKEKVEFRLPIVFTIGPEDPEVNLDNFKNYAKFLNDMPSDKMREAIGGMIEGETRTLTAQMTVEDMFSKKDAFRETVVTKIAEDIKMLGLKIYNANIKEMSDMDEKNKYFEYRKQRAIQTANYQAQAEVAEAERHGKIGVATHEGETRISKAQIEKDAKINENNRQMEVAKSQAELAEILAETDKRKNIANMQAQMEVEIRTAVLQKDLQLKVQEQELEKHRALSLAKTKVDAEMMRTQADAELYKSQQFAEGQYAIAKRVADGIAAKYDAQAKGLQQLLESADQNDELVKYYVGIDSGILEKVAKASADAVQGMKPTVTLWNTPQNENGLASLAQNLVPLYGMVKNHVNAIEKQK